MMTDLAKVKRNVAKMVGMGAPEADIDAYIGSEGSTPDEVRAFKPAPQVDPGITYLLEHGLPGQGHLAFADQAIEAIPIAGPAIKEGIESARGWLGGIMGMSRDDLDAFSDLAVKGSPVEATAGQAFGAVAPLALAGASGLGAKALGMSGNLLPRVAAASMSGAGITGADALARGDTLPDAGMKAIAGALLGGGTPLAAKGISAATRGVADALKGAKAAVPGAGAADELKDASRQLFAQVDKGGAGVTDSRYVTFLGDLDADLKKLRINPTLDPKSSAVMGELRAVADGMAEQGGRLTLGELHNLRQIAQKAAQSREGRDAMFGSKIVDALDDLIATTGDDSLKEGIGLWAQARRTQLIEEAVQKAQNQASGFENGLRTQFRHILDTPKLRQGFTQEQIEALETVVRGTTKGNLLRLLGRFGFGTGGSTNALGGFLGGMGGLSVGGPVGAAAVSLGASGARKLAEKETMATVAKALQAVSGKEAPPPQTLLQIAKALNQSPVNLPFAPAAVPLALQR